jgi:hypothetical protein
MLLKTKLRFLIPAVFLLALVFTTCEAPMGMGSPIDWEDPILTMVKVDNPFYVRKGAMLRGTATDNIEVTRITFTDRSTGKELFPVVRDGDNWFIELDFKEEQNGAKIIGEIRAYDRMNNSSERSVAIVTMIIDILPPIVTGITIKRTDTQVAYLNSLSFLKDLETTDRFGEKQDNLYDYQNGWFTLDCKINDKETTVNVVSLDFYDVREPDTLLKSYDILKSTTGSKFFPSWLIKEEDIIAAGVEKWGQEYKTNYYKKDGDRYYYRVTVKAVDMSDNESIEEDEGYMCMWAKSDEPKGVLDPVMGVAVARGIPLPVDFFDDDMLLWAYAGLLTKEQWAGTRPVADGVLIPSGTNDSKLLFLKKRLTGNTGESDTDVALGTQGVVYSWKYDKYSGSADATSEPVKEYIESKKLDSKSIFIPTGNKEQDYGEFVLFTITADSKQKPHTGAGPEWTNKNIWTGKALNVQIIDENAPLIVFDTTEIDKETNKPKPFGPEENTFPKLRDGEFFDIVGYTLRENASGNNKVTTFRMAWIPYNMPDLSGGPKGADGYIKAVQSALRNNNFTGMPPGVQYWDFTEAGDPGTALLKDEGNETIGEQSDPAKLTYRRQSFIKKFSVLGGPDDIKPDTQNFVYNNKLENETKLFIFYALDNMGHEVFRQLRILGNKTPPDFTIYDFTHYLDSDEFLAPAVPALPDPNEARFNPGGKFNETLYYPDLNAANAAKYGIIKSVIGKTNIDGDPIPSKDDITIPFQIYPRGTIVKYHIIAEKQGVVAVDKITMKDITFSAGGQVVGSPYNDEKLDLTFCEYYPDVTQRTFLFEATDKLGNVARVQRTVAVTNAAKLDNITTTTQSGTYGIGKEIILQANFSSQVYVTGGTPRLNIRYWLSNGTAVYDTIPCTNSPMPNSAANSTSVLEFKFTVPEGSGGTGVIETLYEDAVLFPPATRDRRPIILTGFPNGVKIVDANRGDSAFIPGYSNESITMPNWSSRKNSLQERKNIRLDGVRPRITSVTMSGKEPNPASGSVYYFKNGETLEFTLIASKDIRPSGAPVLTFDRFNRAGTTNQGTDSTNFKYQRPGNTNSLVFSLSVDSLTGDSRLNNFRIPGTVVTGIVDNADNGVDGSTTGALQNLISPAVTIYIKKSIPAAPRVTLAGDTLTGTNVSTNVTGTASTNTLEYRSNPVLTVQGSQSADWAAFEDTIKYSLDGGLKWVTFPNAETGWTTTIGGNLTINNGQWDLRVRYEDRAGNEGNPTSQKIHVNKDFPRLVSITAVQPNSTYRQGDTLDFNLDFAETVRTAATVTNVSITLSNRSANPPATAVQTLTATAQTTLSTTIKFTWSNLSGKEMLDGLYVSAVTLTGLQDRFGNTGLNSTGAGYTTANNTVTLPLSGGGSYTCPNLSPGLIVDCIAPTFTYSPANQGVSTDNRTVTLTFSEPVMIGSGKITIKPYGDYKIPAVFDNNGSKVRGTLVNGSTTDDTYVDGFYDIYNSSLIENSDRQTLTRSANATNPSMGNLELDTRTGQSAGPYIKLTQGLKEGPGFTGNYTNTTPGANGPSIGGTFMVPDTSTKWVLDYRYSIDNNNNTQYVDTSNNLQTPPTATVNNIRGVLTKAHWRWQEMELVSAVTISTDGKTATIKLNEPLLVGLQWDFSFPEGAFTDKAGNKAAALGGTTTPYWFWSNGVQPPVIRVNRKSFDARTSGWSGTNRQYGVPADKGNGTPAGSVPGGWGIGDFNYVHYRIESETPGATIRYATLVGDTTSTNRGSITAAWTGTIANNTTWARPDQVNGNNSNTNGDWVLPNLVRRSGSGSYTVTENGFTTTRSITNDYKGYRSYNRDATKAALDGLTLGDFTGFQGVFEYAALQASKNYVVAVARRAGTDSSRSYEGVFRSLIAMNLTSFGGNLNGNNRNNNPIVVQGSNVKNGMPSISGFPVYDAGESGDNRFLKLFYYDSITPTNNPGNMTAAQIYWVSTEIVSQWYFLGYGGTHWYTGDVNNYLFSGYGDLSYVLNPR